MLASDVYYRARVCVGPMLGRVSMWIHPLQGIHIEFARVNAYYDKARYTSLIARENITRWNIARQLTSRLTWPTVSFVHPSRLLQLR